jgi:vacuolar protein sorting-associated protein 13A/C
MLFLRGEMAYWQQVYQPSDFAIINTDGHSDFEVEKRLQIGDQKGGKLQLKLNYV